jgi:replicative superfamily II helicase
MGDMQFNGTPEEWEELVNKNKMSNQKQTAVEWLEIELEKLWVEKYLSPITIKPLLDKAKEMEKEQRGYTKEDVLKAGEMGEINHHDTKHIVSYLDEARDYNETYGGNK